jgi:hypothetical protein
LQGNLRVCKECCEIFTEFRLAKVKAPEANQTSDSMKIDHTPTSPHPSSLQVGVESSQPLQGEGNDLATVHHKTLRELEYLITKINDGHLCKEQLSVIQRFYCVSLSLSHNSNYSCPLFPSLPG